MLSFRPTGQKLRMLEWQLHTLSMEACDSHVIICDSHVTVIVM